MFGNSNIRRYLMPVLIAVTLVVIAVPTCQMVGCSMNMSRPMFAMNSSGMPLFTGQCDGRWVANSGPAAAITPASLESLVLALVGLVVAIALTWSPSSISRLVPAQRAGPPPPPLDPRGERFTI